MIRWACALFSVTLLGTGCTWPAAQPSVPTAAAAVPREMSPRQRRVRATGTIQALRVRMIQVPQISGQSGRMILTSIIENGRKVARGDTVAELDRTTQVDLAREAAARVDDFTHQIAQKQAENASKSAERTSALKQAGADFAKAQLQLRKGPLLSDIDRQKNQVKSTTAEAQLLSLKKSGSRHDEAEAAAVRIMELQRQRQTVALERAKANLDRLVVQAPLAGMVALENIWKGGSMGPAKEGDQVYAGMPLVKLFDPSKMVVLVTVSEPDGAVLQPGATAKVYLDAYPGAVFDSVFELASPVAAAALGSPIKTFNARFRLLQVDPRLLPDLSAALDIEAAR